MIRVVLDTNIFVSALLQPLAPPTQVFLPGISGSIQMCVSANVFAESEEVIRRPKFNRAQAVIDGALQSIREGAFGLGQRKQSALVPIPRTTCSLNARMAGDSDSYVLSYWKFYRVGRTEGR